LDNDKNLTVQKRKKGIETASRILEVSADLFAHQGYDGISMREIAQAAGIKESSLYNHFCSKASILEALFNYFVVEDPLSRPTDAEVDWMLAIMQPEEIFKSIAFHISSHVGNTLANTVMIINFEKFRNKKAAEIYYQYVVSEPADYYERLIKKMINRGMLKPVDARMFAEQYIYVSITLTKEYFMAKNGLADLEQVVKYLVKTINFFCEQMKA